MQDNNFDLRREAREEYTPARVRFLLICEAPLGEDRYFLLREIDRAR